MKGLELVSILSAFGQCEPVSRDAIAENPLFYKQCSWKANLNFAEYESGKPFKQKFMRLYPTYKIRRFAFILTAIARRMKLRK